MNAEIPVRMSCKLRMNAMPSAIKKIFMNLWMEK